MSSAGRGTMVEELHAFKVTGGGDFGLMFALVRWAVVGGGGCRLIVLANWSHFTFKREHIGHFHPDFHRLAIVSFFSLSSSASCKRHGEAYPQLTCNY